MSAKRGDRITTLRQLLDIKRGAIVHVPHPDSDSEGTYFLKACAGHWLSCDRLGDVTIQAELQRELPGWPDPVRERDIYRPCTVHYVPAITMPDQNARYIINLGALRAVALAAHTVLHRWEETGRVSATELGVMAHKLEQLDEREREAARHGGIPR